MSARLTLENLVVPGELPAQPAASSPAAADYARRATELTVEAARRGWLPYRVSYGDDPGQRLDVYARDSQPKRRPVLLFFHGGAWISGYLWWTGFMAEAAAAHGFLFVGGTYRLAPRFRYPAQLDDVNAAIAWANENIEQHGGDPSRIVVGGHSAGGHLSALSLLLDQAPHERGIAGCAPVSAPLDVRYPEYQPGSPEERVYKFLLQKPDDDAAASPILYTARTTAPFHVTYGEKDFPRIADANARFLEQMERERKRFTAQRDAGASHFDTHLALRDATSPWYAAVKRLLGGAAA